MSKVCMITGARPRAGNSRSHSNRATNRWFKPNIIEKKLDLGNGLTVKIKMTARAYKKIKKNGGVQSLLVG